MSHAPVSKLINCAACTKTVRTSQQLKCSKCASYFHAICVNITDLRNIAEEAKSAWLCPLCKSSVPKSDNTNTPVRATVPGEQRVPTASAALPAAGLKFKTPAGSPLVTPDPDPLESLVMELKLMREELGDLKTHMKMLSENITSRLDDYSTKCEQLEKRDAARENEVCSLRSTVAELQVQLLSRAQASLRNELEISGLPETNNENLMHIVRVTAQKIGIPIDDSDLDYATRVGPRNSNITDNLSPSPKLPRPLVVRFVQRHKREDFLKAAKSRRNLESCDLGVDGPSRKVYFNERLTKENRHLFRSARQRSGEAGYKYCWTKNGTILLRRQEGSPAIAIKSSDDLERFMAPRVPVYDLAPAPI